jgi:hypothetical protein
MKLGAKHKITNYDGRPHGDSACQEEVSNET